jgi:hypothetical protein
MLPNETWRGAAQRRPIRARARRHPVRAVQHVQRRLAPDAAKAGFVPERSHPRWIVLRARDASLSSAPREPALRRPRGSRVSDGA